MPIRIFPTIPSLPRANAARYEHLSVAIALALFKKLDSADLEGLLGPRQFGKVFAMRRVRSSLATMVARLGRLGWRKLRRRLDGSA